MMPCICYPSPGGEWIETDGRVQPWTLPSTILEWNPRSLTRVSEGKDEQGTRADSPAVSDTPLCGPEVEMNFFPLFLFMSICGEDSEALIYWHSNCTFQGMLSHQLSFCFSFAYRWANRRCTPWSSFQKPPAQLIRLSQKGIVLDISWGGHANCQVHSSLLLEPEFSPLCDLSSLGGSHGRTLQTIIN